jgi:hypothetical protein
VPGKVCSDLIPREPFKPARGQAPYSALCSGCCDGLDTLAALWYPHPHSPARILDKLGVFAEFETNLRRERQLEGIVRAKAVGVYKGRPASIDADQVRKLKADGLVATETAKTLKIGRASRILRNGSAR